MTLSHKDISPELGLLLKLNTMGYLQKSFGLADKQKCVTVVAAISTELTRI